MSSLNRVYPDSFKAQLGEKSGFEHLAKGKDIDVLALVKGEERYIFLFTQETRADVLKIFGRFASNPELSFSWYDGAVLSHKVCKSGDADQ